MSKISIDITKDEALVLFEFLSRFTSDENLVIQDQAEERALWNLTCAFEKVLVEPLETEWHSILESARSRLRDENGSQD